MHYYFSANIKENSYIVLGDTSGSVTIVSFNPTDRGPFKQRTTRDVITLHYEDIMKVYKDCNKIYTLDIYIHFAERENVLLKKYYN